MAVGPDEFFKRLEESGLLNDSILAKKNQVLETDSAEGAAAGLVEQKLLTPYQGEVLVSGDQIPLVVGDYVVTDSIGRGGMGYVLKARHRRMKRQVAIKFLLKSLTESDDLRRRFEREVEAAAQLDHQNIVTAYDAGIHEGSHYLVMQYVDGDDLSHIVKSSGPLEIPKAVDVIRQAAVGLGYAHDQGIVHRDIKPGNLLLDGEGVVRILDMGLARMTPSPGDALEGGAQADLTNTGSVMGTIDYMAPEQALDAKSVDSRADLYALGCTLYFLVTGNPPFRNETVMRRLLAHREEPAPRISAYRPEAPSELDQIFATMMAKSPDDRFPSMKHLVVALDSLELTDSEDEQMATMDMPDDESGGFISMPDEDVLGLSDFGSDDESSTGSMTRKLPNSDATMLETPTHASAMSALENAVATSPAAASPDTDFTGIGETIIGDSPSALGIAADRSGTSGPPWKLIAPIVLAVVALIAFLMTRPGPAANSLDPTSPNTVLSLPQGATPPDESQSPDSSPLLDPDRRAAEWVLSVGGKIRHEAEWGYFEELPDGPFQLQGVDLTGSAATNEGLVNLRGLTHLGSINLLGTQITDQGLAVLTDSGRVPLPSLEILDARHLPISDDGIGYLAGSSHVRTLILSDTQVSDLRQICENFPELVRLTLEQTSVTGKSLVHLEKLRRLTVLEISGSQLRGGGTHVAKLTALKALSISDASDGFESDVLTKLTNLDDLHLTGSSEGQLDGKFWSTVSGLPQLTGISFQGPGTTSAVLDQMPVLKQLRHLTIKLTSAGGAAIANAVKKQPQLESLHLGTSQLDDADAKSLEPLTALTTLGLQGNPDITVAAIESLQKALPHCRIESAHGVFGPDPAAMSPDRHAAEVALELGGSVTVRVASGEMLRINAVAELPTTPFAVWHIRLDNLESVDDDSLSHFRGLNKLFSLTAVNDSITDRGLANLTDEGRQPLPALHTIILNETDVSQDGLEFLSGSRELHGLLLSGTAITSGEVLGHFPKLSMLNVAVTSLETDELRRVVRKLPELKMLDIDARHFSGETAIDTPGLSRLSSLMLHGPSSGFEAGVLSRMESLKTLSVIGCSADVIDGEFWKSIAELRGLETLIIKAGVTDQSLAEVSFMPQLRIFSWSSKSVSGTAVAKAMSKFPNVTSLKVTYSDWSDDDVQQLHGLKTLRELDLTGNPASVEAIKALAAALPDCRILSDHGTFGPTAAAMSPDRRAAVVALKLGGSVTVRMASDETLKLEAPTELPTAPFVVTGIILGNLESIDDDSLTNFRGLKDLIGLSLVNDSITDRGLANLTDEGRQPLTALLRLYLDGTDVSQDGLQFLSGSRDLQALLLAETAITRGDVLGQFPKLGMLNLSRTSLETDELRVIRELPQMGNLAIDARHFSGETATDIADLSSLHTFALVGANGFESSVLSRMESLKLLKVRECAADAIDGAFWNSAAGLRGLESLSFSDVTDQSLAEVSSMPQLRSFEVTSRSVSGTALAKAMSKFPNVASLKVTYSDWSDDDVQQLHGLKTLRELDLTGNVASVEAIKALSAALPDCRILSDHGTFGPPAAAMTPDRRAAEAALKLGGSVTVMDSAGSVLSITDPVELPAEPFAVTEINLLAKPGVDDASLANFRGLTALRKLILTSPMVTDSGLANLTDEGREPLQALQFLYLAGTDISQDGLQFLSGSSDLGSLFLSETAITDTAVLVRFPGLTLLNTEGTALKAGDMDVVASLPLLGQLQMDGRHFSGSTVDHIAGLPNLTHLNLFELPVNIDMSAFARLHQVTNLLFYSATPAAFDDEFWKAVATLEKLESLVFGASGTGELFAGALPMPQLRDLTVQSGHVRGSTVAKAMSKFPNLTFLEVRHSAWTDEDVRLLHDFKSLRQLNLPGNKASAEAIKALSAALPACRIESDHGTFGAAKTE